LLSPYLAKAIISGELIDLSERILPYSDAILRVVDELGIGQCRIALPRDDAPRSATVGFDAN
jgi:hypothetical protein